MADTGTTQNNFILPAPPVGGLPISQDWLNRMKLIQVKKIPILNLYIYIFLLFNNNT